MKSKSCGFIFRFCSSLLLFAYLTMPSASADTVVGGTISTDTTWNLSNSPYIVNSNVTVKGTDGDDGVTTLTIESGVVVKFSSSRYLKIGASSGDPGALIAQGTSENQILFTSTQSSPAPGDWGYIYFYNTTDDAATLMEHCVVEYGGASYSSIYLYDAAPKIQNTTIRYSKNAGIYAMGSGTNTATVTCNTFASNMIGISWRVSPPPQMHNNNFLGNTDYGLYYTGSETLDAENNWWGDAAGPDQSGDAFYGNVDADPWAIITNQCSTDSQNYPPNIPSSPSPSNGASNVLFSSGVILS